MLNRSICRNTTIDRTILKDNQLNYLPVVRDASANYSIARSKVNGCALRVDV